MYSRAPCRVRPLPPVGVARADPVTMALADRRIGQSGPCTRLASRPGTRTMPLSGITLLPRELGRCMRQHAAAPSQNACAGAAGAVGRLQDRTFLCLHYRLGRDMQLLPCSTADADTEEARWAESAVSGAILPGLQRSWMPAQPLHQEATRRLASAERSLVQVGHRHGAQQPAARYDGAQGRRRHHARQASGAQAAPAGPPACAAGRHARPGGRCCLPALACQPTSARAAVTPRASLVLCCPQLASGSIPPRRAGLGRQASRSAALAPRRPLVAAAGAFTSQLPAAPAGPPHRASFRTEHQSCRGRCADQHSRSRFRQHGSRQGWPADRPSHRFAAAQQRCHRSAGSAARCWAAAACCRCVPGCTPALPARSPDPSARRRTRLVPQPQLSLARTPT